MNRRAKRCAWALAVTVIPVSAQAAWSYAVSAPASGAQSDPLAPLPMAPSVAADAEGMELVHNDPGFAGTDLAFLDDLLVVGSVQQGDRLYSLADPAHPELVTTVSGPPAFTPRPHWQADPDLGRFGNRVILALNTSSAEPGQALWYADQVTGSQFVGTQFFDVTVPAQPVPLAFLPGDAHNGDIVAERGWFLPSRVGASQPPNEGKGPGLEVYDMSPLLADPPAPPTLIECSEEAPRCHQPLELWRGSPHRLHGPGPEDDEPVGPEPYTGTHDISLYTDYRGTGRDIALLAELGDNAGTAGSVFVIDVTDPAAPVVLNRWHGRYVGCGEEPDPTLPACPDDQIFVYHEAQLACDRDGCDQSNGDPTLMVLVEEAPFDACALDDVHLVRLSPDLTAGERIGHWRLPPTISVDPIKPSRTPDCWVHQFNLRQGADSTLYIGAHTGGTWVLDLSDPANPRDVAHYDGPDGVAWGAAYYRGYVYSGDLARGLDVFRVTEPEPASVGLVLGGPA